MGQIDAALHMADVQRDFVVEPIARGPGVCANPILAEVGVGRRTAIVDSVPRHDDQMYRCGGKHVAGHFLCLRLWNESMWANRGSGKPRCVSCREGTRNATADCECRKGAP